MIQLKHDKYLVTGGAGFIGSHICEEIVKQRKQLICLDDLRAGNAKNVKLWWDSSLCTMVEADIKNPIAYERYFEDVDIVFHEAASKCTVCRDNPIEDLLVNAWGSWCVFECARRAGVKKIIHASTGSINHGKPTSFYGVSKQAGESYLRAFREYHFEFLYTILRYYHVYGSRQDSSAVGGVVPIFIRQTLNDDPITIHGDGNQLRHFTHVKDVVKANFLAAVDRSTDYKTYDVVSDTVISINELAKKIILALGKTFQRIDHGPAKQGDIKTFKIDNGPLKKLGFKFDWDFTKGLADTIEYYKKILKPQDYKLQKLSN
jgi:UDP-glucose 4-epimerase